MEGSRRLWWRAGRAFVVTPPAPPGSFEGLVSSEILCSTLRSKNVGAVLPVPTVLGFPVSSLIQMNLLTCDLVFAFAEPTSLIVVVMSAWKRKKIGVAENKALTTDDWSRGQKQLEVTGEGDTCFLRRGQNPHRQLMEKTRCLQTIFSRVKPL